MPFSVELVDEARRKKALGGDMTPVCIYYDEQAAKFLGSEGQVYDTTLDSCTCTDFAMNLGQQRPCKHIIRLAMELDLYDKDGMVSDPEAANAKYSIGLLRSFVHDAPLNQAVQAQKIIDGVDKKGVYPEDDALAFAGIPSLRNSCIFTVKGKKQKIVPAKSAIRELEGIRRTLLCRLGALFYDNLSCEPIKALIDKDSMF